MTDRFAAQLHVSPSGRLLVPTSGSLEAGHFGVLTGAKRGRALARAQASRINSCRGLMRRVA